jgi:hypothetical protein
VAVFATVHFFSAAVTPLAPPTVSAAPIPDSTVRRVAVGSSVIDLTYATGRTVDGYPWWLTIRSFK